MANRQNTFLLKRSNVSGKIPLAGDLQLGELALNTADVVLYASGTTANSILPIGWDRVARTGDTMTGTLYAPTVSAATLSATVISFNTTYTGATPVGSMTWNTDFGVPQVGMVGGIVQKIGETVFSFVRNGEATTLNKGEVVYIFGATGDKISVKRASNTGDTTSSKTLGVVAESIVAGGLGYVITQGTLDGLNLGAYTAGDTLWLSSIAGQYTNVKQYAPNHTVFIGVVQRANNGNGQLYVLPQNGYELEELHNVMTTGATYGDLLTYSAYNGNNVWTGSKLLNGNYTVNGSLTVTGNTNVSGTTTSSGDVVAMNDLKSMYSSGNEGGQIFLNKAATNTTLSGGVTVDVFQNRVRIFEQDGTNRGVYIDLTAAAAGVGTNLLSGGGGEINTASNLGSGTGLFAQKVAADLQFKSLTSTGGTVTISNDSTTVNLEAVSSSFTGGTVNGATNFTNGLTANTTSTQNIQITSGATAGYFLTSIDSNGNAKWSPIDTSSNELDPVLSITGAPPTASVGDRYLISGGTGIWSGRDNDIAEYTGATSPNWSYTEPTIDDIVYVTDTLVTYYYNGTNWIPWRGTAILQNGNSLTTSVNIGSNNNQNLTFRTSGQTRMTVTSGGNIGIGTTTPSFPLDIISNEVRISGSSRAGSLRIQWTADNTLVFNHTGIGPLFSGGPSNRVTFGDQALLALKRGGQFASDQFGVPYGLAVSGLPIMPSGNTNDLTSLLMIPTINNNSLYSGITRGIYYNPTVTSLGSRNIHRAIETTSGDLLFSNTSLTAITKTGGFNIISGNTNNDMLRITQTGSGNAFVVEDESNPDSSPFVVTSTGNVGIGVTSTTQNLQVAGTSLLSGSGQNILTVIGSGNSTSLPIFSVQGSQGELFSVSDSLTGSLFSVNDISGLPILDVFSDSTILMGSFLAPSLNTTVRTSLTAGTNTIYSIPTSAYTGAFFEYTLVGTGLRAGNIVSIWSGSTAEFTETSTNDIGLSTSGVTFNVSILGNNAILTSSATTSGWTLKTIISSI